jgi:hypothetical protein
MIAYMKSSFFSQPQPQPQPKKAPPALATSDESLDF